MHFFLNISSCEYAPLDSGRNKSENTTRNDFAAGIIKLARARDEAAATPLAPAIIKHTN